MRRWLLALLACVSSLCLTLDQAAAAQTYTPDDVHTAIRDVAVHTGVSQRTLERIVWCESRNNPYAVGRAGEIGPVQLHPRGELSRFRAYGFTDPRNPWESVGFLALRLQAGGGGAWSCR